MPVKGRLSQSVSNIFKEQLFLNENEHFARCGTLTLRLRFTSRKLANIFLPSFLPARERNFDLTIAFAGADDIDLSQIIPTPRDLPRIYSNDSEYAVWQPGIRDVLSVLNFESRHAFVWLPHNAPPAWYASRPALPFVHAMTTETPWSAVHGGCVGLAGRCLLLAGKGKSGKTTASLSCARASWDYAGDDFVLDRKSVV